MPFGACTATATPSRHKEIRGGLGFDESRALMIIEKINRPNLFFGVRVIEGSGLGDKDLLFLIPENFGMSDACKIPKTIIYIDQKKIAPKIAAILRNLLPADMRVRPPRPKVWNGDPRSPSEVMIPTYHGSISETMKGMIVIPTYHGSISETMKGMIEEDWKAGRARIMIASSAWGMGVDDPDVERVIQWGVKKLENLDTVVQRFGRAGRNPGVQGACFLFTEAKFIGPRAKKTNANALLERAGEAPKRRTAEEVRRDLEDGLYRFLNTPGSVSCRRKVLLGYYGDQDYHSTSALATGPCCDLCGCDGIIRLAPILNVIFRPPARPKHIFPRASNFLQMDIRDFLTLLRQRIFERDYSTEIDNLPETWVFSDAQLHSLVTHCRGIQTGRHLLFIPNFTMDNQFHEKYGNSLCYILN